MSPELPASALYSHPSLARLWKKVHLACSPFILRPTVRQLYSQPAPLLRSHLKTQPYHVVALGCAEGFKEALLLRKLPQPSHIITADTSLAMARIAARKLPAKKKSSKKLDLTSPSSLSRVLQSHSNLPPTTRLLTLFGVLPNLDPPPLLHRLAKTLRPCDLLLFSTNLAPGKNPRAGALRILPQYENPLTRRWLQAAARRYRPRLPQGQLVFQISSDPRQPSLARIEARWISSRSTKIIFSSRRPTAPQVEAWLRSCKLLRLGRWIEPRGEEGLWLVRSHPSLGRDPKPRKG
ncbi:MAG: hypothetical protein NTU87_05250 [Verrucomicrobia bacterium]|nr:hypothetical protein [Verrucomicrobiota bacterium]